MPRIIRKHHPPYSKDYTKYKPYLRQDFNYRCAYCTIHEGEFGGLRNFVVEHFRPRWKFSELECEYTNLYYACRIYNVEPNQRRSIRRELELLKGYLQILDEQFVNPRIPYEEEDLQI